MQTFLPFPDFGTSAAILDRQRLGKQRVENLQIMKALLLGVGYSNHPAVLMWRRYEWALLKYHEAIVYEWTQERGYQDTTLEKVRNLYSKHAPWVEARMMPDWLGDEAFHLSHKSNLIRKDPWHYYRWFAYEDIPTDLPYIWPTPLSPYKRLQKPDSR